MEGKWQDPKDFREESQLPQRWKIHRGLWKENINNEKPQSTTNPKIILIKKIK